MSSDDKPPMILVVEDDDLMREYAVETLRSFGYAVAAAESALSAMKTLEEMPSIKIVFIDVQLPGLDGITLADMVKQHRPKLKILYTTGGQSVPRAKAGAGILHGNILSKPYHPVELRREVERLMG
jgi:CheY-like chemotaxis protein